jgi:hypothetical protein
MPWFQPPGDTTDRVARCKSRIGAVHRRGSLSVQHLSALENDDDKS